MSDEAKFASVIDRLHQIREETGLDRGGKKYSMVKDRVEHFRRVFGSEFGINTTVEKLDGQQVLVSAKITDRNGIILASGHSMEFIGTNEINTTSYVESAETQAIGRALASFGLHGGEFASEAEMVAVDRKKETTHERATAKPHERATAKPESPRPAISGNTMKFYIPAPNDGLTLEEQISKVADELTMAGSTPQLMEYWTRLKTFLEHVDNTDKELYSEMKAAFTVAWKVISGKDEQ